MSARQDVFAACERIEVVGVEQEAGGECAKASARATPPCEIQVFRQRVRLVPSVGKVRVRTRRHLGACERFLRQVRQRCIQGMIQNRQRSRVAYQRVCVAEADIDLVEGIGRQRVASVEMRREGWRKPGDQPLDFLAGCVIPRDGIGACKAGNILAETVAGNEAVHIERRIEARRGVVPAAEILPRRCQVRGRAERFEQRVFVHGKERRVLRAKLFQHRTVEQGDVCVAGRRHRRRRRPDSDSSGRSSDQRARRGQAAKLQDYTTGELAHGLKPIVQH